MLKTVPQVIDALGGGKAVAAFFGIRPSAVSNWKAANAFPESIHMQIFRLVTARDLKIAPRLIGGDGAPRKRTRTRGKAAA